MFNYLCCHQNVIVFYLLLKLTIIQNLLYPAQFLTVASVTLR